MKQPLITKNPVIATLCTIILLASHNHCTGQDNSVFTKLSLAQIQKHEILGFTVSKEVNVFHYIIEASNDSLSFEVIGVVRSKGNAVLGNNYQYEIFQPMHKYYRVCKIGMNASLEYSWLIQSKYITPYIDQNKIKPEVSGSSIARNTQ